MNQNLKFSLLILLFFGYSSTYAKEIDNVFISKHTNNISCDSVNNSFISTNIIKGETKAKGSTYSIYFTDLATLENITVKYKNKKGKTLLLTSKDFYNINQSDESYYSGVKNTSFIIPFEELTSNQFEISYTLRTTNIRYFNELHFYSQFPTDTLIYTVATSSKFRFIYNINDYNKTNGITIDSIGSNFYTFTKYNIKNIKKSISNLYYIQNYSLIESIRFYFCNLEGEKNGYLSLSNWYYTLSNDYDLKKYPETETEFKKITKGSSNKDSILKFSLEYVKNKIRYIAIEDGINAFKPRNPSQVLHNKKGDCKDMALLITNILRLNNIEAYIALITSNGSKYDFDFPSLSSANHAICVAKLNNKWIILDATDPTIPYPLVSRHTQGKTAFIIKNNSYEFYKVPITTSKSNTISLKQNISITDSGIYSKYTCRIKGYPISDFIIISDENNETKRLFNTEVALENLTNNMYYFDTKLTNYDSVIHIEGNSSLSKSLINISLNKVYLGINFLPIPIKLNYLLDSNERVLLQTTSNIELESSITTKSKFKLTNPKTFEYNSSPYRFKLVITQITDFKISIKYQFTVNYIFIDYKDYSKYQQFCNELKKASNYVLVIQ